MSSLKTSISVTSQPSYKLSDCTTYIHTYIHTAFSSSFQVLLTLFQRQNVLLAQKLRLVWTTTVLTSPNNQNKCSIRFPSYGMWQCVTGWQDSHGHGERSRGPRGILLGPLDPWEWRQYVQLNRAWPLTTHPTTQHHIPEDQNSRLHLCENSSVNPLKTKHRPLYLKTQFIPHSKHFSSQL